MSDQILGELDTDARERATCPDHGPNLYACPADCAYAIEACDDCAHPADDHDRGRPGVPCYACRLGDPCHDLRRLSSDPLPDDWDATAAHCPYCGVDITAGRCRCGHAPGCTTADDGHHPDDCAPELDALADPHDHEPDDAGARCRVCGLPADPAGPASIGADALELLALDADRDPIAEAADWSTTLRDAAAARRRFIASHPGIAEYVTADAAAYGLVPLPGDEDGPDRMRELGQVWAIATRARPAGILGTTYTLGERRELDALHDAHEEREALAGRPLADPAASRVMMTRWHRAGRIIADR